MSDDLKILRDARDCTAKLIEGLAAQREQLQRFSPLQGATGEQALGGAIDSAAKLLQAIDQAIEKAQSS